jgi:hypothetical protein
MSRTTVMGLALVATGLAAVPIAEGAKPPQQNKTLSVSAAPNPVVFGRATVLSGRLTGKNHAGQTVSLQSDPVPYDRFSAVATGVTSSNGSVTFQQRPRVNTRFKLRRGGTESGVVTVLVRIRTSLRVSDSTPLAGRRLRFSGRACPAHDGARVAVQRRTSTGRWRTVKRTALRSATRCSVYRTRFRVRRDATYRAVVAGDTDHARGISPRRRVDVR